MHWLPRALAEGQERAVRGLQSSRQIGGNVGDVGG